MRCMGVPSTWSQPQPRVTRHAPRSVNDRAEKMERICTLQPLAASIAPDVATHLLGGREPLVFNDAPVLVGHGKLEDGLCQINGDGCSIHVGLLSFG